MRRDRNKKRNILILELLIIMILTLTIYNLIGNSWKYKTIYDENNNIETLIEEVDVEQEIIDEESLNQIEEDNMTDLVE